MSASSLAARNTMATMRRAVLALAILACACAPVAPATPSPSGSTAPTATAAASTATASGVPAPVSAPAAVLNGGAGWYLLPDGLSQEGIRLNVEFPEGDATGGRPRARLVSTGRTIELAPNAASTPPGVAAPAPHWIGTLPLDGAKPGPDAYEIVVRLRSGSDAVVARRDIVVSQPEYVVWTLDFEGDAASDETMANVSAIARSFGIPMTIMWNPRVWTTADVSASRAEAMAKWTLGEAGAGSEVALHLHAWTDYVRAAGVTPRTAPSWAGRSDGYDVPLTAFDEAETRRLVDHALALMASHGMPRPTSFRGGGLFANAANLRAVAAAGFTADTSATSAGAFGRLPLPWTLRSDAQPYRPSRDDANAPGDLPLIEAPNIGGNTYGLTTFSIQRVARDDVAMLAPPTQAATERRAITLVSHPGTVDATERAAIESLFRAFEIYRYDRGSGPLRFVTLSQLAAAYSR
jgi:hypothetical protein